MTGADGLADKVADTTGTDEADDADGVGAAASAPAASSAMLRKAANSRVLDMAGGGFTGWIVIVGDHRGGVERYPDPSHATAVHAASWSRTDAYAMHSSVSFAANGLQSK